MKHAKFVFASAALLAILATVFVVCARQSPSAAEIIAKMKNAYATCRTYRDSGTIKSSTKAPGFAQSENDNFTTAFVRPEQFRFDVIMTLKDRRIVNYIVWLHGKESRLWDGLRQTDKVSEFGVSTTGASGISSGPTYTMTFLFPDGKSNPIFRAADAKRIADAEVEGEDCYCLQVRQNPQDVSDKFMIKFYISKVTFLLRKLELDWQAYMPPVGTMTSHSEVIWQPVINEAIPASALEYNPPR